MTTSSRTTTLLTLPLNSSDATLQRVGGKGANLSKLSRAGFPVPPGFLITTQAYQAFVKANGLEKRILAALPDPAAADPDLLEAASASIRAMFTAARLPGDIKDEIITAYACYGQIPVAVRSSATAEDLPDTSFAGQQDTFLNILGDDALIEAVINCWSSLWTARAILYRAHNAIPREGIALAVVVQAMVQSEVSGVLFTANPLTGLRSETVIDAAYGLGEALVSGQVEPDHYVVDTGQGRIKSKTLGAKRMSIRGQASGGTVTREERAEDQQALPDDQILALAQIGARVAELYDFPQDIEWAWFQNRLYLLQSRPVTSLFPLPDGMPPEPLKVMFSFAAVQGMPDPITPLGQDMIRQVFTIAPRLFGIHVTPATQRILFSAGERLWANVTTPIRNSFGRKVVRTGLKFIEPTILQAINTILDEPGLQPGKPGVSLHALSQIARFLLPLAGNVVLNLLAPAARRKVIVRRSEALLDQVAARCAEIQGDRYSRLEKLPSVLPEIGARQLPRTLILLVSGVASGMASFNAINTLSKSIRVNSPGEAVQPGWDDPVLEVTRGLPNNPTTEMDLALWQIAQAIRRDPFSMEMFQTSSTDALAAAYQAGRLSDTAQEAMDVFLKKYGGRGLGEIDMGRPRWRENPAQVFEMLGGYLKIENEDQAPDRVFERSAAIAQKAIDQTAESIRKTPRGWIKSRLFRLAARRTRELLGIREYPKFFAVRLMGAIRKELLAVGQEFAGAGELDQATDLFFLTSSELQALAARDPRDWKALVARRRETYNREFRRRQIPRLLLSDGRAFYEGMNPASASATSLTGSPVSPGSVEGRVRVVRDPRRADLLPGEIMVCPGTDPSWTPLFLTAGGLIMEMGGMMTHGAVVAREYGIPAVVGVDQATARLITGQRIHLNGSTGQITILENEVTG